MAGAVLALSGSLLYAAPDEAKPTEAAADATEKDAKPAAKPLTAEEISKRTVVLEEQMGKDMVHVGRLQQKARAEKDVIKLNCVNDKLVQMKATMNLADDKRSQITDALTLGNGRAPERFADYAQSATDIKKLREEADVCVGVGPDYLGNSKINISNPGIPDDPTAGNPFSEGLEPPAYASPYS
ncbi:MAG: hypothetical protein R3B48_30065 [Kofleriaceae bacterium]